MAYDVSDLLASGRRTPEELIRHLRTSFSSVASTGLRGTSLVVVAHVAEHRLVAKELDFLREIDRIDAKRAGSTLSPP